MTRQAFADAIRVDEVGIESGEIGGILLKSAYRPIFSRSGEALHIAGFDASTVIWHDGAEFDLRQLPDSEIADAGFLAGLCQVLSIGNYRNLDMTGSELFLEHLPAANRRFQDALLDAARRSRSLGEAVLAPGQVICRVSHAAIAIAAEGYSALETLRHSDIRISLDAFELDQAPRHSETPFVPDVAEIGPSWFHGISARGAAARLLRPLVETHHANDTRVHIRGVSTGEHLKLALAAGADLLSGDYLGRPALAGSVIDDQPRLISELVPSTQDTRRRSA